ncbi:MAG: SAM-dependent methyltransferase [Candidatus Pacearchaeota archaeon]|nr:MAG: SAM-dependent methyltransferase [Candidatus Pacearchaeota archaeon]
MIKKNIRSFDVLGNIAIIKFPKGMKNKDKKNYAEKILRQNKSIKTVLEKTGKFKGRLRKQETKYLAGEKTKEALYKENSCIFRFNVDKVYFSPRLSSERKEIAEKIKKGDKVLVMFAGVAPYSIVIAKNSMAKEVYSNEINREANKYAKLNIELNKLKDKVILLPGNIKKIAIKLKKQNKKFDAIVMPRPQLKENFLKEAFMLSKKGTKIFYYDFCKEDEIDSVIEKIKLEAKKLRKKIKILKVKKSGEIAPYKFRVRVDFIVLN